VIGTHKDEGLAKDWGARMEELNYGVEAVDQLAMLVPIRFECLCSALK
jgi:hypothetical protein